MKHVSQIQLCVCPPDMPSHIDVRIHFNIRSSNLGFQKMINSECIYKMPKNEQTKAMP